jgi:hypothetical protein
MALAKVVEYPLPQKIDFINLTNRHFAEYEIIFRVNDGFSLKSLGDFSFKEQLLFQRFKNINQQLNLMLIDSVFPLILADMALLVLLGKIKNLNDYINSKERIIFPQIVNDKIYFERKIVDFINGLLYGEVGGKVVWNGDTDNRRIFCIKNTNDELDFYSIFERNMLLELLKSKMKIEVNIPKLGKNKNVCISLIFKYSTC